MQFVKPETNIVVPSILSKYSKTSRMTADGHLHSLRPAHKLQDHMSTCTQHVAVDKLLSNFDLAWTTGSAATRLIDCWWDYKKSNPSPCYRVAAERLVLEHC